MDIAGPKNALIRFGSRTSSVPMPVSTRTSPCASVSISRQCDTSRARSSKRPSPFTTLRPRVLMVQQSR